MWNEEFSEVYAAGIECCVHSHFTDVPDDEHSESGVILGLNLSWTDTVAWIKSLDKKTYWNKSERLARCSCGGSTTAGVTFILFSQH